MVRRNIGQSIVEAMQDTPVVLLQGARQTGKSTLARAIGVEHKGSTYLTLDDATVLAAATADPQAFLQGIAGPVVLDEVQRAPGLFPAIKQMVDQHRQPGRYLLTGSADVLLLPQVSESLAGRVEILTLWPFSVDELSGRSFSLIDALFSGDGISSPASADRAQILNSLAAGGFPEAVTREAPRRRAAWFGSYITTILQRDIRDISQIENLTALPRLLQLLAARSMSLLNNSEISRALGLPNTTLRRYLALLEMTFLVLFLPPWSVNLGKRLVKSPKTLLCDTGLLAYLLGVQSGGTIPGHVLGPLVENYVAMELKKQAAWSNTRVQLFHYRDQSGREVDLLLENAAGQVVGVEVKASAQVSRKDFQHLQYLQESLGPRFVRGVVLYLGAETVSFGNNLHATPLDILAGERHSSN